MATKRNAKKPAKRPARKPAQGAAPKTAKPKGSNKEHLQCGKKCPNHTTGACYLDFGHSTEHKCSYAYDTW